MHSHLPDFVEYPSAFPPADLGCILAQRHGALSRRPRMLNLESGIAREVERLISARASGTRTPVSPKWQPEGRALPPSNSACGLRKSISIKPERTGRRLKLARSSITRTAGMSRIMTLYLGLGKQIRGREFLAIDPASPKPPGGGSEGPNTRVTSAHLGT